MPTPQEEFDAVYVTSTEIRAYLAVSRSTIVRGKERGMLPNPILINGDQIQLWRRADVAPYLEAWKKLLRARSEGHAA